MKRNRRHSAALGLAALLVVLGAGPFAPALEREPLEVYRSRRTALASKLSDGVILLFGNSEPSGSEAYHRFWQESNFYYLTGYAEPGAVLLLVPPRSNPQPASSAAAAPPLEILFLPERDPAQERWRGPRPDPQDADTARQLGLATVKELGSLEEELRRHAAPSKTIYTLLPNPHGSEIEQAAEEKRVERIRAIAPSARLQDARRALAGLRQAKSPTEVKLIERAVDCTLRAHRAAAQQIGPGLWEYEVAALMKYAMERAGCERPSFDPIVASGPRSTILHYTRNSGRLEAGELIVLDVGAEYAHYAADITRTLPVNGRFTSRQREIYEIVLGAQKAALAAVRPGRKLLGRGSDSLHQIAYDYINHHGKDRHGEPLGKYFTHGLSHHVGLEVHDAAEPGAMLEPGMVITIEPGIYLPEENLGVRIEDMVLVTESGSVLLTGELPREVEEIERWMQP